MITDSIEGKSRICRKRRKCRNYKRTICIRYALSEFELARCRTSTIVRGENRYSSGEKERLTANCKLFFLTQEQEATQSMQS